MSAQLSLEMFPTWAHLNDVQLQNVKLQGTVDQSKGSGIVAESDIPNSPAAGASTVLMKIPRDLVLSAEAVDDFAKVDKNFHQLLAQVGHQSIRDSAMIYMISHLAQSRRPTGLTPTPWTEYIRMLPRSVPVPTMWTERERELLVGTSLETALQAKLSSLTKEFEHFRERSEALPFWDSFLWTMDTVNFNDWVLVDAWYRSRCLQVPRFGTTMVPGLDMVNHSSKPLAYYDQDFHDDVVLLMRPEVSLAIGTEVTISYGEAKSAAEMLFSYGFLDATTAVHTLTLRLDPMEDDPLGKAKMHIFKDSPTLEISRIDANLDDEQQSSIQWHSPWVYLMCLNEEDGLEFQLLQDLEGQRQLRLLWQAEDVTDQVNDFESLIQRHNLGQVFELRTVIILHQKVEEQLARLCSDVFNDQADGFSRSECVTAAEGLKVVERGLLEEARQALDQKKTDLLSDDRVLAYLQQREDAHAEQSSPSVGGDEDEDDFS